MSVSIIIPAYNAAKTITETLQSLLAQTYRKWEAIVVDDGSTDATSDILRGFVRRDKRIRLVRQPNGGQSEARNAGIALTRYGLLVFLDADDWIAPAYLERMTAALSADPTLDAVHCLYVRVASDGTLVFEQYMPPTGDMFPTLARRATFPPHACILRRSLVNIVGPFDTSLRASPDWDFFQRVARTGARFGTVREILAFYRMSPQSASQDAYRVFDEDLLILRRGHSPDPRVQRPHPDHISGSPPEQIQTQVFYLLCWCAGLLLGRGEDPRPLLDKVGNEGFPELYPEAVAQCIFDSAPLSSCQPPYIWEQLWPKIHDQTLRFLSVLELTAKAPDLARRASASLKKMILKQSKNWQPLVEGVEEIKSLVEEQRSYCQRLADERAQTIEQQQTRLAALEQTKALLAEQLDQAGSRLETLEQAKAELEKERIEAHGLCHEQEQALQQQRATIRDLEETNKLLANQVAQVQTLADERAQTVHQLRTACSEWEEIKALLTNQLTDWKRLADERDHVIGKQRTSLGELEQVKTLLTEQLAQSLLLTEQRAQIIKQQGTTLAELEHSKALLTEELAQTHQLAEERIRTVHQQRGGLYELKLAQARVTEQLSQAQRLGDERGRTIEHQKAAIEELERAQVILAEQLAKSEQQAQEQAHTVNLQRASLSALEQANNLLQQERSNWQAKAKQQEWVLEALYRQLWVRLGLRLRALQNPRKKDVGTFTASASRVFTPIFTEDSILVLKQTNSTPPPAGVMQMTVKGQTGAVSAATNEELTVVVTNGPGNATDWLALYPVNAQSANFSDSKYLANNHAYTIPDAGVTNGTVTLTTPNVAGNYEVRFMAGGSYTVLMTSGWITVTAPTTPPPTTPPPGPPPTGNGLVTFPSTQMAQMVGPLTTLEPGIETCGSPLSKQETRHEV